MSPVVHVIMWGWIPIVLYLFEVNDAKTAVIRSFLFAWLMMPIAEYSFSGLPEYNKISATCYGILLGTWLFDRPRLSSFHFGMMDLPITIFCFSPLASSLSNDLGLYDGLSCSLAEIVTWGLPYLIGRVYFNDERSLNRLAAAAVAGGLVYVPLCLIEIRFSPQLHNWVYGFHQNDFGQTMRMGGFRPVVFMVHGLMVGMWMASATLCCIWLCLSNAAPSWLKYRKGMISVTLLVTFVLVKSTGALGLFTVGLGLMLLVKKGMSPKVWLVVVMIPMLFIGFRAFGDWDGKNLVEWAAKSASEDRAQSLEFRIDNEQLLMERGLLRPIFGWGDWGRWRVHNDIGEDITIADSLWIIVFGRNGLFGLFGLFGVLLWPAIKLAWSTPASYWCSSRGGGRVVLAGLLTLYAVDCLLNAMVNPFYAMCAGGLMGVTTRSTDDSHGGEDIWEEDPSLDTHDH